MQINANDFRRCSLASGPFSHIARRLTCKHTWLMKWVLVRPVASDVTKANASRCQKGFWVDAAGRIPGSSLGQWKRCTRRHMPTTVTAAGLLCMERHMYDTYQDSVHHPPLLSLRPAVFVFIPYWFSIPLPLPRSFHTSSHPHSPLHLVFFVSLFLPPAPSLFFHLLVRVSRPPSTSIVEFRQAIYISPPGCLTLPLPQ